MTVATRAVFTGSIPALTPGTWTPDGTPATIDAGAGHKSFPGLARLDSTRLLLVYRSGTSHAAGGSLIGRIGTLTGYAASWGSEFTILDHATLDVRCDDAVSVVDGRVVITGRYYDGSDNIDPFLLVSDDLRSDVDSATTWSQYSIGGLQGDDENIPGMLIKVGATCVLPVYHDVGGTYPGRAGVLRNASLTDWSAPTYVEITGTGYTEISVERLWGEYLLALIRTEADDSTSKAVSTDGGATWGSVSAAHDGYGQPMFLRLSDGTLLTVYRDSPDGDTAWRTSADNGTTWSSETILDTTGTRNTYAAIVQLDNDNALVVYSVEDATQTDGDIYSQLFTRS